MKAMSSQEAREFILRNRFGVLSLADDARAYGLPLYYGYDGSRLYFQTRAGLKQRYAVATREACFTIVRVLSLDEWASVQVFGPLARMESDLGAQEALMAVPLPPDWGETPRGEPARHDQGVVLYALAPRRVSGRFSQNAPLDEEQIALGGM